MWSIGARRPNVCWTMIPRVRSGYPAFKRSEGRDGPKVAGSMSTNTGVRPRAHKNGIDRGDARERLNDDLVAGRRLDSP